MGGDVEWRGMGLLAPWETWLGHPIPLASAAEDEAMFGHLFEASRGGDDEGWSEEEDESAESGSEAGERDELDGVFDTSSSEVRCMVAAWAVGGKPHGRGCWATAHWACGRDTRRALCACGRPQDEAGGVGGQAGSDVSGDEGEGLVSSDEDEALASSDEGSDDDEAHAAMLASVAGVSKQQARRKHRASVVTEAFPEAEHNMPVNGAGWARVGPALWSA